MTAVTSGSVADQRARRGEVVDDGDLEQQPAPAPAAGPSGHSTTSTAYVAPAGSAGQAGVVGRRRHRAACPARPRSSALRWSDARRSPRRRRSTATASAARAERGGDGGLVAGPHREQRRDRAEQSGDRVGGGQQGAGAVLAVEAELEGLLAGASERLRSRSACCASSRVLASRSSRSASADAAASCSASRPSSPASRPATRVSSAVKSRCARSARASASSRAGVEPADLLVGGRGAGLRSALTWPCSRARPSRRSAAARCSPAMRRSSSACGLLGRCAGAARRCLEGAAVPLDLGGDLLLLRAHPLGLGLELLGVAARRADARRLAPAALRTRSAARPAVPREPLSQPGEPEPGLLRRRPGRAGPRAGRPRGAASVSAGARERRLDLGAPLEQDRLVGELLLQRGAGRDQVVGHQPGPGVADVGLDDGRPAGHLGLATQRLELAADLGEQVAEPGEVALGGVELAERLLLALAVLEDAGRLLDEAAPVLGGRVQDRVELALADDDVHLAADAGVARAAPGRRAGGRSWPLMAYSEPPLRNMVRLIVTSAYSIGSAPSVLSMVSAHLGATQRRAPGGAGEDDVLHLAAAQRLGALLAHHPGERVDDVGLAGAVGTHDAGDARLELQGRRGREGLEPA